MRSFAPFRIVCLAALALGGCGLNPSGNGTGTTLRVANLMPGTTAVTVSVGDTAFMTAAPFETFTGYQDITAGNYRFNILLGANPAPVFTSDESLANVSAYTFIAYGPTTTFPERSAPHGHTVGARALGQLRIPARQRFADRGPDRCLPDGAGRRSFAPPRPSCPASLQQLQQFRQRSARQLRAPDHAQRNEGSDLRFRASGSAERRRTDGGRLHARQWRASSMSRSSPTAARRHAPNRLARLKAVNASAVASPLNLFVDGALTLANVPYTGVSNYQVIDAGTRTITVEAAPRRAPTLLTTSSTFTPATDTSIALYGSAGALGALILTDANVTYAHAQGAGPLRQRRGGARTVDVYANGTLAAGASRKTRASPYVLLDALAGGTTYQFDFDPAGTTTPALTSPASVSTQSASTRSTSSVRPAPCRASSSRTSDGGSASFREERADGVALLRDVEHAFEVAAVPFDDDDFGDAALRPVALRCPARQLGREDRVRRRGDEQDLCLHPADLLVGEPVELVRLRRVEHRVRIGRLRAREAGLGERVLDGEGVTQRGGRRLRRIRRLVPERLLGPARRARRDGDDLERIRDALNRFVAPVVVAAVPLRIEPDRRRPHIEHLDHVRRRCRSPDR